MRDRVCGQCLQDTSQYVLSELAALEAEQKHVDGRAAVVERRLRSLMETGEREGERRHRPVASWAIFNRRRSFSQRLFVLQEMTAMKRRG